MMILSLWINYEIIKEMDFKEIPLAETILNHHEKLDGSGYPRGLKENEINLESKIIAVADVVEAMASHRPYRPSLGIDAALEEINNKKGVKFDKDIVESCISLFKEDNYKFKKSKWVN